jgi:hypothetical protein
MSVYWIKLAQDRVQSRPLLDKIIYLRGAKENSGISMPNEWILALQEALCSIEVIHVSEWVSVRAYDLVNARVESHLNKTKFVTWYQGTSILKCFQMNYSLLSLWVYRQIFLYITVSLFLYNFVIDIYFYFSVHMCGIHIQYLLVYKLTQLPDLRRIPIIDSV